MAQRAAYEEAQTKVSQNLCAPVEPKDNQEMSEHDQWLLNSPEIIASVKQGLAESAAGRVRKRPSYAEYADDVLEE